MCVIDFSISLLCIPFFLSSDIYSFFFLCLLFLFFNFLVDSNETHVCMYVYRQIFLAMIIIFFCVFKHYHIFLKTDRVAFMKINFHPSHQVNVHVHSNQTFVVQLSELLVKVIDLPSSWIIDDW